jgi:hypothetical protein
MFLAAGEHQWRPARADNFENIGNDLTIAVCVGYERSIRVVNRELGGVCRRTETGISRNRQVPKRRATNKARSVGTARVAKMAGAASSTSSTTRNWRAASGNSSASQPRNHSKRTPTGSLNPPTPLEGLGSISCLHRTVEGIRVVTNVEEYCRVLRRNGQ